MIGGGTEASSAARLDLRAREEFDRELADENYRLLTRSAIIFGVIYVLWGAFDYFLVPEKWEEFVFLRLIAAGANAAIVGTAMAPSLRRFSAKAFWLWFFVWGIFVVAHG